MKMIFYIEFLRFFLPVLTWQLNHRIQFRFYMQNPMEKDIINQTIKSILTKAREGSRPENFIRLTRSE
jgi:hypothetical protein